MEAARTILACHPSILPSFHPSRRGDRSLFDGIANTNSSAYGASWVFFTLTEEVYYSITGNFLYGGLFDPAYSGSGGVGVGLYADSGTAYETDGSRNTAGYVELGDNPIHYIYGSDTGRLPAGQYRFLVTSSLKNGVGTGQVVLTLSVPDAGSTMTLLGMALAALGCLKRRIG